MQQRRTALQVGLVLGVAWALWHVIPLVQAHRPAAWIAWWSLGTVASRVIIVWLYNNAGRSVPAAALYHAVTNFCWQLFPNSGSHYTHAIPACSGRSRLSESRCSRERARWPTTSRP